MNADWVGGARLGVRRWLAGRRPEELVDHARLLFLFGALATLAATLPGMVLGSVGPRSWWVLLGAVVLGGVWVVHYRIRGASPLLDGADVAVTVAIAALGPDPMAVIAFVFSVLWFRALYGGMARLVLFCVAMAAGLQALRWVPALLADKPLSATFLPIVAAMVFAAAVARYLAGALFVREAAQRRVAVLAALGQRLIGTTDRAAIWDATRECVAGFTAATAGLVVLAAWDRGRELEVVDPLGDYRRVPATLPRTVLPADPEETGPVVDLAALAGVAGPGSAWTAVPPGEPTGPWLFVGGPPRVVGDVVPVVESMLIQVTLAIRTREAHLDLTLAATSDPLTGLANRGAFTSALLAALGDAHRRVALLFLDLDDFKLVNDGLGHAAGDELLRRVGMRMREGIRDGDLCARLGGDEFAVLLIDADDTALVVAQRLVERIASPVSLTGRLAQVGASVGLAFSGPGMDVEELVQHADIAMYAAKAKGKNRVQVFDPTLLREDGSGTFEDELAAAAGAGQLVVHYQPIVSVADGRCSAVEALVRWAHPTRGLLAPAEFIPTAERTGAVVGIGAFVMQTACTDVAAWSRDHGPLAVHVNVSVAQLTDPGFAEIVRGCLVEFALAPRQLVLEITESMVLDSAIVRAALDGLVQLGVAVAIDDFGTGYAALSTLRQLPLHIIKIDKSFLPGAPAESADEAIVEAVVQMAGRLGLQVVAEGVERPDQQQFLRAVGADAAQGYLYLRPTAAPRFAAWLDRNAAMTASDLPGVTVLRSRAR